MLAVADSLVEDKRLAAIGYFVESSVLAGFERFGEEMALVVIDRSVEIVEGWWLDGIERLVRSKELTEAQKFAIRCAPTGAVGFVTEI